MVWHVCLYVLLPVREGVSADADNTAENMDDAEHLPAPIFSSSPSPVAQGPHSRWGAIPEADHVSEAIVSPILGSTELRTAVAAAQARATADLDADESQEKQAEEQSDLSQPPVTPAQPNTSAQQASSTPADKQSSAAQAVDTPHGLESSDSKGDASATVTQDCIESSGGSLSAEEEPHISQEPAEESTPLGAADATEVAAQGQDTGSEESGSVYVHSAALQVRLSALSIEVDVSSMPAQPESASTAPAQHAGGAASPYHSLASPNRFLEGLESPELHASMSPGTPAEITLQPAAGPSPGSRAASADSASVQVASDSCLSPAATEPEEALTPASQQAEAAAGSESPAQALTPMGETAHYCSMLAKGMSHTVKAEL